MENRVLFATIPGGDRADGGFRTARVENGQLVVESNDPGETGGAAVPNLLSRFATTSVAGKLKQVGKVDTPRALSDRTGQIRQRFDRNDDQA